MSSERISAQRDELLELANREYKAGFVTDIESETIPAGLNEDIVRIISAKKNEPEWLLQWRAEADGPKSPGGVDPKLLETYEKLGIPLRERAKLAGVAVDAVFDSVSVATTFKDKLGKAGVIFCSFSDAVRDHPRLVERYLGSVVPTTDNFFAALNSAVFSDGSFVYVPP